MIDSYYTRTRDPDFNFSKKGIPINLHACVLYISATVLVSEDVTPSTQRHRMAFKSSMLLSAEILA